MARSRAVAEGPARDASRGPGVLALVGGDEFMPGNEQQDELLVREARRLGAGRQAFVIASAAVRQAPDQAVATARAWFAGLGLEIEELPLRTRRQGSDPGIVEQASRGGLFYLAGGDPGLVVRLLEGTPAWSAAVDAWRGGAILAGSSAGAMAMGSWTLLRARHPGDARRDARPALGLVRGIAVAPHYETFGHRWVPEALPAVRAAGGQIVGIDERTAAVWQDGVWSVVGPGAVTVVAGDIHRFEPGERGLPLPEPGIDAP